MTKNKDQIPCEVIIQSHDVCLYEIIGDFDHNEKGKIIARVPLRNSNIIIEELYPNMLLLCDEKKGEEFTLEFDEQDKAIDIFNEIEENKGDAINTECAMIESFFDSEIKKLFED